MLLNSSDTLKTINNLNHINKKISELIDISLSDFLYISNLIKEFNNRIVENSKNYNAIIDQLNKNNFIKKAEDTLNILRQQKRDYHHFIIFVNKLKNILNETFKDSEKLSYQLFSIYNNVCTIKILLIDYNITNNKDANISLLFNHINELLNTINDAINIINNKKNIIKLSLKNFDKTNDIKSKSEVKDKYKHVAYYLYFILKANHKIKKIKNNIDEKTKNIDEFINNTIIQLQYQDIVRQKFEHVSIVHQQIIDKIQELKENLDSEKYLENTSNIIYLEAAQIIHANNIYNNALKNIFNNIWKVNEINENLNNDFKKLNKYLEYFSINFLNNLRKDIIKANTIILNCIRNYENSLNSILQSNHLFEEKLNDFFNRFNNFKISVEKINCSESNNIGFSYDILKEINKIVENIDIQSNELKTISENITIKTNYEFLSNENNILIQNKLIENIIQNISNIKLLIFELILNFKEISILLSETNSIQPINNKISLEGIKYYENFEKEIKDIINKLIELAKKFKKNNNVSPENLNSNKKSFDKIKKIYTIKSEYLIHDNFANILEELGNNTDENILNVFENKKINDTEGDVELF